MISVTVEKSIKTDEMIARCHRAAGAVAYLIGTRLATDAMRLAPVDTGYLRSSRYVTHPSHSQSGPECEVGFSASYAAVVEEGRKKGAAFRPGHWFLARAVAALDVSAHQDWFAKMVKAGKGTEDMPTIHPTGPLIGPEVTPRRRRRASKRLKRQARIDALRGSGKTVKKKKRKKRKKAAV